RRESGTLFRALLPGRTSGSQHEHALPLRSGHGLAPHALAALRTSGWRSPYPAQKTRLDAIHPKSAKVRPQPAALWSLGARLHSREERALASGPSRAQIPLRPPESTQTEDLGE